MALSEHEQRILDEIEKHLAEDDPRFVQRAQRVQTQRTGSRRLALSIAGFVVGFLLLLGLTFSIVFGLVGVALMFTSVVVGATAWRHRLGEGQESSAENSDRSNN